MRSAGFLEDVADVLPARVGARRRAGRRLPPRRADRPGRHGQRVAGRTERRQISGPGRREAVERRAGRPRRRRAFRARGQHPRASGAPADRAPHRRRPLRGRPALSGARARRRREIDRYCDAADSSASSLVSACFWTSWRRWRTLTRISSCTAISSRPTCWSPRTAVSSCSTSASPSCSSRTAEPGEPADARRRDGALTPAYAAPEQVTGGAGHDRHRRLRARRAAVRAADRAASGGTSCHVAGGASQSRRRSRPSAPLRRRARHADGLGRRCRGDYGLSCRQPARGWASSSQGDLDIIVAKALKKNPSERYATVNAFADDLRRYLNHEPISARADTFAYRTRKFVRRNRTAVALAALALVALLAGLVGHVHADPACDTRGGAAVAERRRADQQARDATEQRDFARRQLSRAEAINDLNAFLISDARPLGTSFTARDLLVRAERIVDRQRGDAEDIRVETLIAVGRLYQGAWAKPPTRSASLEQAYARSRAVPTRPSARRRPAPSPARWSRSATFLARVGSSRGAGDTPRRSRNTRLRA